MRTVLIDDESQIVEGLGILLKHRGLSIVATANTFSDAVQAIERHKPDLVFLDIQLHNKTGFDVLNALEYTNFKLVFITAYNQFAIKAFKYNAFDYLLKPIDSDELYATLDRIMEENTLNKHQIQNVATPDILDHIIIRTTEFIYNIALEDILYCRSDQGYTHFYTSEGKDVLSSKTLKEYVTLFPKETFVRVHQSYLVHWKYVEGYRKGGILLLKGQIEIPVSVRKRSTVQERLK